MKKLVVRLARQSPAMIVSMLALFVALTGTAVATTSALITGAQIKNNSITGADVKNKSLTPRDFRGSVRGPRGLRGLTGATGAQGPQGPQGTQGLKGDKGDKGADFTVATTLQSGQTESGGFAAWGSGTYFGTLVNFRVPLAAPIPAANRVFIAQGSPTTANCPGSGEAAAGYLCVYEKQSGNRNFGGIFKPSDGTGGVDPTGFSIFYSAAGAGGAWSYGDWTVRAP